MNPEPGIYPNTPFPEYLEWEAAHHSVLKWITSHSPAHAKEYMDNPPEPTEAMKFGTALHTYVLEPETFEEKGKEDWANFEAQAEHREIIDEEAMADIKAMAGGIEKHDAVQFVRGGVSEVGILWQDEKTGVMCKARFDHIHPDIAMQVDVKSTKIASYDGFRMEIYRYLYHQQFASYSAGWEVLTGDRLTSTILACEKKPPYAAAVYGLHEDTMAAGRNLWRRALDTYAECLKNDDWPGYFTTPQVINLPDWALRQAGVGPDNL
jgi:exodeoxyribonuclease VIII